jgi:hypothetical protein
MESYNQAVNLSLAVVNLDSSVYKTMIRSGLVNYLNSQYLLVQQLNNENEMKKFVMASKILLNDLQAIPVSQCAGRTRNPNPMLNSCDNMVDFKTPVYQEALINTQNMSNSNVSKYTGDFNENTFNTRITNDCYGCYMYPKPFETFGNPTTHPTQNNKNADYNQYSQF